LENIKNLSLEFRPKCLDDFYGNEEAIKFVRSKTPETMPKALFIHGLPGTGKTSLARVIFDILGGDPLCIEEYNMGTQGKIETARTMEDKLNWMPGSGKINGFIFDEAHKTEKKTLSAFLKPLEDAPDFNYFIFCTSDKNGFLKQFTNEDRKAFLRRCVEIEMKPILDKDGEDLLCDTLDDLDISEDVINMDVIDEILAVSDGIPSVMYKNLEAIMNLPNPDDMISYLKNINRNTQEADPEMKKLYTCILCAFYGYCE